MIRALVPLLLALALAACASVAPAPDDKGRFVEWEGMAAEGLPDQRVSIWLPPGYDTSKRRYPVLYMWDGQNLFDPAKTHYGKAWMAQDVLGGMVARGHAQPHIVVGIWSPPGKDRYRLYLPQHVYDLIGGAVRSNMDEMAGGPIGSNALLAWTAYTLKARVDAEFRTRPGPGDTSVVGASMGGLIACYAAIERPEVFGRAGCVSAHFALTDPALASEHSAEIERAWQRYLAASLGPPGLRRIWMDHGTAMLDASYAPWQRAVAANFAANGWRDGEDFTARVYQGAEHDETAWNARMAEMLAWLWREDRR